MFISNDENSLFYRVPCDMLSFLDGCPSKVTQIKIDYNEDTERVTLCASYCEDKDERARFTVGVGIERLFQLMLSEGIRLKESDESLYSIRYRQPIIVRAISTYLKRNVQILEFDPTMNNSNILSNNQAAFNRQNSPPKKLDPNKKHFELQNNEGNFVRRPKMTLPLLAPEAVADHRNSNQIRRRTAQNQTDQLNTPADLAMYQLGYSNQVRDKIDNHIQTHKDTLNRRCQRKNLKLSGK